MPNEQQGWCTTSFSKEELDGKKIFFTMPSDKEYYTGHMHVTAGNAGGQFQIEIDYGRPLADGTAVSNIMSIDQPWLDKLARNSDPNIIAEFIIHPLD
jgi:hypothetical protein